MRQIKPFVLVVSLLSLGSSLLLQNPVISQTTPTPQAPVQPTPELPTKLVLKLRERKVHLYKGDKIVASYGVAIGKKGWETPTGNFKVIQMVKNPTWQNPWTGKISPSGPSSPLGERWIGFWSDGKNFIGFHGTPGEHLIGQAVSHGCVRMRNKDIKSLYEQVKMGIPVIVQP
jgi:lipoprotein-anchoring transpeptidase ErfK/SrfK